MTTMRLEARNVSKTFGSTKVLSDAELLVAPGEIHALIGQNGSGKSTLVKILTGYHAPDPGMSLSLDGQPLELPAQWRTISAAGIAVVHQDLGLLDQLTVAENIGVGGFLRSRFARKINWKAQADLARKTLARLEVDIDPSTPVGELNAVRRAEVAIARAMRNLVPGEGLIILDEATRALPREELSRFHDLLRRVISDGTSVLMVTHNLDEVLALTNRVTVLRDGRVAGSGLTTSDLTEQELARLMLGKTVDSLGDRAVVSESTPVVAAVANLGSREVDSVSFEIRAGEVVGLTGLAGSGFEAIPYLISGARPAAAGSIRTAAGTLDLRNATVNKCMNAGIALVPERRDRDGLAMEMSIRDNIALPNLSRRGKPWRVSRGWQDAEADDAIAKLSIRARNASMLVKELSGGNQQKVLFAKWMSVRPSVLVLHEPTQAVDVGARRDILSAIMAAAESGVGVLLVSIEPSDLVDACNRILVFRSGEPLIELRTDNTDDVLNAVYSGQPATAGGQHVQ